MTKEAWYSRPGSWFWILIALGVALRIYLVVFTQGTYDVGYWELHAKRVNELGLLEYYHSTPYANHPPFILRFESFVFQVAEFTKIPFPTLLRAPFALLDAASAVLLLQLLGSNPWRFVLTAAFWISPLSVIFSAYHGNTDSALAFFIALVAWLLFRRQTVFAGIAMGVSFWIKLPGVLAFLAFILYLRDWRRRFLFLLLSVAIALVGYFPTLIQDPGIIMTNVFGYHGRMLQTQAGVPAWGPRVLLFSVIAAPEKWPEQLHGPVLFFLEHNWQIGLLLAAALISFRYSFRSIPGLCATIAMAYTVLCGLTDYWAFQYFAWSLPFWFFLRPWFFVPATLLVSGYIYSLYWTLCENPWLLGTWDFAGHFEWPRIVILFRNLAVIFFIVCACFFLIAALGRFLRQLAGRVPLPVIAE